MATVDAVCVRAAFQAMAQAIRSHKDELTKLDSRIGDGDLGVTADKGFAALAEEAGRLDESDISSVLAKLGAAMNRAAPSTMGTLFAFALLAAARVVKGKTCVDGKDVSAMLAAAVEAIQTRGKARLGDKTILDALIPAQQVFASAIEAGEELTAAWSKATAAAEEGLARTVEMPSRAGRAAAFGQKTKGIPDPGAYEYVLLFRAVDECLRTRTSPNRR